MAEVWLTIGQLAQRAGVASSALRYYESQGLLSSVRQAGGQRRFRRDALRRVAFIRAAQQVGLSLQDIAAALASLPDGKTPDASDWSRLSAAWQPMLQARIDALCRLRDQLSRCIGCGCLSLERCQLYNPQDQAAQGGGGARYWLGGEPPLR
ncbi:MULTISPECIES: redox-sensitive transcriptional activator SoxR [unclassified Paludibacterium]|uniref:redox-sensitive transcriptional activator SoxR n=1 Tax=unclassified Paludibacterium TaxID=2618429 RepID=UPI001C05AC96|nr:redox-sensitive transcriptional activator SoxR [Paludibacterium sp. B53371]BEV70912.1 redox-sensitive transcriptional activator SoxR [Paludibacterium sp. THUN1379]